MPKFVCDIFSIDAGRQRTTDTGFTMTNYLTVIRMIVASAIFPACAIADANAWYITPAEQGDCGEEWLCCTNRAL